MPSELKQQPLLEIGVTLRKPFTIVELLSAVEQVIGTAVCAREKRQDLLATLSPQLLEEAVYLAIV
jgi:hypothetical protein